MSLTRIKKEIKCQFMTVLMEKKREINESVGIGADHKKTEKANVDFLSFIIKFSTPIGLILFSFFTLIQILTRS